MKYVTAVLGFLGAIMTALFYREKSKRVEGERDQAEAESEALNRINEGLIAGQEKYEEITADKDVDLDHFSRVRKYSGRGQDSDS